MKRKITLISLLTIIAVVLGILIFGSKRHHNVAANYQRMLYKTHINLPRIAKVKSWDNYDRGASRWDCIEHSIVFNTWPSDKAIKKMERLCAKNERWVKEEIEGITYYTFLSAKEWNSDLYFYSISIFENNAHIEYYIDEDEGLFCYIICIPLLILFLLVFLFVWTFGSNQTVEPSSKEQ